MRGEIKYDDLTDRTKGLHDCYGWVFTYNPFTDKWRATNRDNYNKLWDGPDDPIIESSNVGTLVDIVVINGGSLERVMNWKKQIK